MSHCVTEFFFSFCFFLFLFFFRYVIRLVALYKYRKVCKKSSTLPFLVSKLLSFGLKYRVETENVRHSEGRSLGQPEILGARGVDTLPSLSPVLCPGVLLLPSGCRPSTIHELLTVAHVVSPGRHGVLICRVAESVPEDVRPPLSVFSVYSLYVSYNSLLFASTFRLVRLLSLAPTTQNR